MNNKDCFRAYFNDDGPGGADFLNLNGGTLETIDFAGNPQAKKFIRAGSKALTSLTASDFGYFRLSPEGIDDDAVMISGVELSVKFEGDADHHVIYRNPCVNRFLESKGGKNHYSPHGPNDDAFCFLVETADSEGAGTDNSVSITLPLTEPLDATADAWIQSYTTENDTPLLTYDGLPGTGAVDLYLNWEDDDGYDDRERNKKTSYGATVYNGQNRFKNVYNLKIHIYSYDAWKVRRVKAVHFRPGDPEFLKNNKCKSDEWCLGYASGSCQQAGGPNPAWGKWLSQEVQETEFHSLGDDTCPELSTIKLVHPNPEFFGVK